MHHLKSMLVIAMIFVLAPALFSYQILVRPDEAVVGPGAGVQFHAQTFDRAHNPVRVRNYHWRIVPENLGTISSEGYFIAGQEDGRGRILATATIGNQKFTGAAAVIVGAPEDPPVIIKIQPENAVVPPGEQQLFKAIAQSENGVSLRKNAVRWTLNPRNLGEISAEGVFTAGERAISGKIKAVVEIDRQIYHGETSLVVSPPPTACVSGKVTDDAGQPLAETRIIAERLGGLGFVRRALTGEQGEYVLNRLVPGTYIIHAEASGYLAVYYENVLYMREATPVDIAENDSIPGIDFNMNPGASISGLVQTEDLEPLENAHVYAAAVLGPRTRYPAKSDQDGRFIIKGLPNGTYYVHADKRGYQGEYYDNVQQLQNAASISVHEGGSAENINFTLDIFHSLRGTVTHLTDGTPIQRAVVTAFPLNTAGGPQRPVRAMTGENGEYAMELAPGFYLVHFSARGFEQMWYENAQDRETATPVQIFQGEHTVLDFGLQPLATVSGLVTDSETGGPVSGALIRAFSEGRDNKRSFRTRSDSLGGFSFPALPGGDYLLAAQGRGYIPEFWQEADSPENATIVSLAAGQSMAGISFTLATGGAICGVVTDSATGLPLTGAVVHLAGEENNLRRAVKSDTSGEYTFVGLPTGTYFVRAASKGYNIVWYPDAHNRVDAGPIQVTAPETVDGIDVALGKTGPQGGRILGKVIDDSTGLPIHGALVAVMPLSFAKPRKGVTAADGTYEIAGLMPGRYIVMARARGYIAEFYRNAETWLDACPVELQKDEIRENIDFDISPQQEGAYLINGHVTKSSGHALGCAVVFAREAGKIVAAVATNETGSYVMSGMPAGNYKLTASGILHQDGCYLEGQNVTIGAGKSKVGIDIKLEPFSTLLSQNGHSTAAGFKLEQNYPNPFNPVTHIDFSIPQSEYIELSVYNVLGHEIRTLYRGIKPAGRYSERWDGTDNDGDVVSSGLYFCRLKGKHKVIIRRMLLMK